MQGYKVKEKTAIVPPVSKLSGHPARSIISFEVYSYCTNATMYYIILTGVSVCSIIFSHLVIQYTVLDLAGCPLSFETGGPIA
jgi:hypothetical protein